MRYIAKLLRDAADSIEESDPDRAAWRIADAGGLLRELLDMRPATTLPLAGFDEPTGRGYLLPLAPEAGE